MSEGLNEMSNFDLVEEEPETEAPDLKMVLATEPEQPDPAKYVAKAIATGFVIGAPCALVGYHPQVLEAMFGLVGLFCGLGLIVMIGFIWAVEPIFKHFDLETKIEAAERAARAAKGKEERPVQTPKPATPYPENITHCELCEEYLENYDPRPLCAKCKAQCVHYMGIYNNLEAKKGDVQI